MLKFSYGTHAVVERGYSGKASPTFASRGHIPSIFGKHSRKTHVISTTYLLKILPMAVLVPKHPPLLGLHPAPDLLAPKFDKNAENMKPPAFRPP